MKLLLRIAAFLMFVVISPYFSATTSAQVVPQGQLPLTGLLGAHDPTLFKDGDFYYVVRTNSNQLWRSPTLNGPWASVGTFPSFYGGSRWAPHAHKAGDTWYIYYATSTFGTNNSRISVMSSTTPGVASSWVERNPTLITSGTAAPGGGGATYNAIDPAIHQDNNGDWWIVFGSHFDGIMIQRLNSDMISVTGHVTLLAHRGSEQFPVQPAPTGSYNRLEGPVIFERNNYFYLITAWDWCCRANPADNTYKVVVGRSENITGPYVDKNGRPLAQGGGSIILNSRTALPGIITVSQLFRAPGGSDIYIENGVYYIIYHAYRPATTMAIRVIDWHDDWPYFYEGNGGPYDLRDGAYYRLINQDGIITDPNSLQNPVASNRCLTATDDGGLDVVQAQCNNDALQQIWQLEKEFDGFYRLRNMMGDQSYCLEIADASGVVGTNVVVAPCRDTDNTLQQWYFDDTGHGFHRPVVKQANFALEIENVNGVIGTNVVGGYRRDGNNEAGNLTQAAKWPPQQWRFSMVNGPIILGTPANLVVEATSPNGAPATYEVPTAVDVVDGTVPVNCIPPSGSIFPLGTTTVTCSATDSNGNSASTQFTVTVVDTTAPTLNVSATPNSLWPPNHKMVTVDIAIAVADNSDPQPQVTLLSVTSNEPDNGQGDGDTPNDIVIVDIDTLQLRAERGGQGGGRIYAITYEASDDYGNSVTSTTTVTVPLSKSKNEVSSAGSAEADQGGFEYHFHLPMIRP